MNLILDDRDQKFVLQELLDTEDLCRMPAWSDFSPDMFDMALKEAQRLSVEVIFPALVTGDREGCRLSDGQVFAPPSFRRCFDLYRDGGWINMGVSPEAGGQGFPMVIAMAAKEWFIHNFAFFFYPEPGQAAARYFIKHVLPEVGAAVNAFKSEDLSMIDIPEESFAV